MVVAIETLCETCTHQKYVLAPIDSAQGDSHIMFVYFFRNIQGRPEFMSTAVLLDGFAKAAHHFSILLGHVSTECNRDAVLVDPLAPNVPRFKEIHTDMLFDTLSESEYHWNSWPEGLDTQDTVDLHNGKPLLLSAVLMRFRDNSGVALRVKARHSVIDGTGFTSFMRFWCNTVRASVESLASSYKQATVEEQYAALDFNRQTLLMAIGYSREPSGNDNGNNLLLEQASQENDKGSCDSYILQEPRDSGSMHIFRFSEEALDHLKRNFSSEDTEASVNDALTSLIWRAIARSSYTAKHHRLMLACDVRRRIGLPQNYMGNASFPLQIDLERQDLLDKPKHTIASAVRTLVNSVNAKYLQQCLRFLNRFGPILDMETKSDKYNSFFCTTNCSRFPFYQTDFGYGKPERVLVPHYLTPGFSIWLPVNGSGGIDVIISMLDCDFSNLSLDNELLEYCRVTI